MPSPEFSINATALDAAGKEFHFPVRAAWIRGALEEHEATAGGVDGELDVRVSKSGSDVVVHGTLKAELVVPCARCLDPVRVPVLQPISALIIPAAALKAEPADYEFSGEEAETLTYEGDTVVLDDIVRDELVLETPMIPLCREDCPGISPPPDPSDPDSAHREGGPGSKPIDPRLAPLLRIKATRNNKE